MPFSGAILSKKLFKIIVEGNNWEGPGQYQGNFTKYPPKPRQNSPLEGQPSKNKYPFLILPTTLSGFPTIPPESQPSTKKSPPGGYLVKFPCYCSIFASTLSSRWYDSLAKN
eukprot:scaffold1965_cov214-Chaetoceros_neogracile.AAC.4